MADSIELYNGHRSINVNNLDILREPSQQLANAIATGPQDEFFSKLEECNRVLSGYGSNTEILSVTPSWNWRPGTLDKIKQYARKQLEHVKTLDIEYLGWLESLKIAKS